MKTNSFAVITLSAFLLTACSSQPPVPESPSDISTAGLTAEAEFTVSPKSTCEQVMGSEGNSTFLDAVTFLSDITDFDSDARTTASELSHDLNGIANRAEPDVKALLLAMAKPIDGLLDASESSYKIEVVDFKAASTELLNRCSDLGTDIPVSGSLDSTPSPIATSGDYGSDLAAAGTVPDSVAAFGAFMEENLCQSPLSGVGSFSDEVRRLGTPGSESYGSGPSVVRLTVAYFCPERVALAEQELQAHGYVD